MISTYRNNGSAVGGVSGVFLREFKNNFMLNSTTITGKEACEQIVKPRTKEKECSFMDLFWGRVDARGIEYVGEAQFRVCFAWNSNFNDTLQLLLDHAEKELGRCYYWMDIFCENYHDEETTSPPNVQRWLKKKVTAEIKQADNLLLLLPDLKKPLALRRSWCVFEIATCLKLGGEVTILSKPQQNDQLVYALVDNGGDFDDTFKVKRECDVLLESKYQKELGYRLATSLAEYLTKFGDLANGERLLNRALRIGDKLWPNQLEFPFKLKNMLGKGVIRRDLEDFGGASELFDDVQELQDKLGVPLNDIKRTEVGLEQAILLRLTGMLADALELLHRIIEIRESMLGLDSIENARFVTELGNCFFHTEDYDSAIEAYKKASALLESEESGNILTISALSSKLGRIYYLKKEYLASIAFYERAMLLTISVEEPPQKQIDNIQSALNESKFKLKIQLAKEEHAKKVAEKERKKAEKAQLRLEKLTASLQRNETELSVN
ncbi:uncharacterized protein LOC134843900 isoform X2 [Symsagittifera roscoffensis]|uniref:uncharacterized protein LOC134843900 isoform X2 n=1 Tax=Symsagittifera roscoffensis TaxID=84072 RepID=UPI00307B84AD